LFNFFFKSFLSGRILDRQLVNGRRLSIGKIAQTTKYHGFGGFFGVQKPATKNKTFLPRISLKISRRSMILSRRAKFKRMHRKGFFSLLNC